MMSGVEGSFGDVEKAAEAELQKQLDLVREVDQMDEDVNSWEAEFLDSLLKRLDEEKIPLTSKQLEILHLMRKKYGLEGS